MLQEHGNVHEHPAHAIILNTVCFLVFEHGLLFLPATAFTFKPKFPRPLIGT
jgi:hypothetical protein